MHSPAEPSSKGKKRAIPRDIAQGDAALKGGTPTATQKSFGGVLKVITGLFKNNAQAGETLHSSPQSGASPAARSYTDPTPAEARNSDGSPTSPPEHRPPTILITVNNFYNAHNTSPPPIINHNNIRINNRNTVSDACSSESEDGDEGEHYFPSGCLS